MPRSGTDLPPGLASPPSELRRRAGRARALASEFVKEEEAETAALLNELADELEARAVMLEEQASKEI